MNYIPRKQLVTQRPRRLLLALVLAGLASALFWGVLAWSVRVAWAWMSGAA